MSDMKDAFRKVGIESKTPETKCQECGKPFQPKEPHHKRCSDCMRKGPGRGTGTKPSGSAFFPEGYPDYFDADGLLKPDFVTTLAEEIARNLGEERPKMGMHQLRAFYGHVKLQEGALKKNRPFKEVFLEISKLKPFASERASKEKLPRYFEDFIIRNVDKSKDEKSFREGFVEHFQAVVAYCAGTIRR
jgi:CRISPR/Cas system CSM-associated protein Csm2 small subunit